MASIVVSGDVLRRPRGANLATHLHYLIGLRKLGHDVIYLEDRGGRPVAEEQGSGVPREGLMLLRDLLRRCRVDVPVVWVDPDAGLVGGMVWPQLRRLLSRADLLIDLGGHCWLEERSLPARRALVDVDSGQEPEAIAEPGRQLGHDLYFSYRREPAIDLDVDWLPTIPPVVPRLWYGPPARIDMPLRVWAEAAGAPTGPGGPDAGGPSIEQLLALPGRLSLRPWMALPAARAALAERLVAAGWLVRGEDDVETSLSSYRAQAIGSQVALSFRGAEAAHGIWFPARDTCFLAAGRPVVAVDGDLDTWLPTGLGLIAVADLDAAVEAVECVQGSLARHAAAARSIAERVFHYRVVLPSLLEQALSRRLRVVA